MPFIDLWWNKVLPSFQKISYHIHYELEDCVCVFRLICFIRLRYSFNIKFHGCIINVETFSSLSSSSTKTWSDQRSWSGICQCHNIYEHGSWNNNTCYSISFFFNVNEQNAKLLIDAWIPLVLNNKAKYRFINGFRYMWWQIFLSFADFAKNSCGSNFSHTVARLVLGKCLTFHIYVRCHS